MTIDVNEGRSGSNYMVTRLKGSFNSVLTPSSGSGQLRVKGTFSYDSQECDF